MTQHFIDKNQGIVERVFEDLLDGHVLALIPELYAEDCVLHGMSGSEAIDREEYRAFLELYFEAFPDLSFEIEEMISDDDRVSVRWTSHGTHDGDLMDVPTTGKPVTVTGITFVHIEDGRIVTVYNNYDRLGLLEQLGAFPDSPRRTVRLMLGRLNGRLTDR